MIKYATARRGTMQREYDLETILTITTGKSFIDNWDKIFHLMSFVFGDCPINNVNFPILLETLRAHIIYLYPVFAFLVPNKEIEPNSYIWIEARKLQYGSTLPICPIGEKLSQKKNFMR